MKIDITKTVMIYLCSFSIRSTHFSYHFAWRISLFTENKLKFFCTQCYLPPAVIFNYAQFYTNTVFMFRWILAVNSDCLP